MQQTSHAPYPGMTSVGSPKYAQSNLMGQAMVQGAQHAYPHPMYATDNSQFNRTGPIVLTNNNRP